MSNRCACRLSNLTGNCPHKASECGREKGCVRRDRNCYGRYHLSDQYTFLLALGLFAVRWYCALHVYSYYTLPSLLSIYTIEGYRLPRTRTSSANKNITKNFPREQPKEWPPCLPHKAGRFFLGSGYPVTHGCASLTH